jgi:hypothetical protein
LPQIIKYIPRYYKVPKRLADVPSAWGPNESILMDLIERFQIPHQSALEFGVDYGFSASALANFFEEVIAVDHFESDPQTGYRDRLYEQASLALVEFPNVHIRKSSFQEWIEHDHNNYDLIHVDVFHDYVNTYAAGKWAVDHSNVVAFHDSESYPAVKSAVCSLADETGMKFYNYEVSHGLGILVRE